MPWPYNRILMVRDGFFYALGLGAVTAALWYMSMPGWLLALPIVLALFFLWFFSRSEQDDSAGAGAGGLARRWSGDGGGVD